MLIFPNYHGDYLAACPQFYYKSAVSLSKISVLIFNDNWPWHLQGVATGCVQLYRVIQKKGNPKCHFITKDSCLRQNIPQCGSTLNLVGNETAMTPIQNNNVASTTTCILVVWVYFFLKHPVYSHGFHGFLQLQESGRLVFVIKASLSTWIRWCLNSRIRTAWNVMKCLYLALILIPK